MSYLELKSLGERIGQQTFLSHTSSGDSKSSIMGGIGITDNAQHANMDTENKCLRRISKNHDQKEDGLKMGITEQLEQK